MGDPYLSLFTVAGATLTAFLLSAQVLGKHPRCHKDMTLWFEEHWEETRKKSLTEPGVHLHTTFQKSKLLIIKRGGVEKATRAGNNFVQYLPSLEPFNDFALSAS
jgi:hypothetical protein